MEGKDGSYGDGFDTFWKIYPRRIGKLDALRAYTQALRHSTADEINEGAKRFAQERAGEDPKFTPHPATWLRAGRWMDEVVDAAPSAAERIAWREQKQEFLDKLAQKDAEKLAARMRH